MSAQAVNPYLPEWEYVPDGEPRLFGDRVYVYGSHDRFGAPIFCVDDYVCWSAPATDLSAWRCEGVIYRKRQDPANRLGLRLLFAPDVVEGPDGRYYLFYAFDFMGTIGVAVCDEPAGRYEFLAHVSWPDGTRYGRSGHDGFGFDPGVLVDDDGRVFLYSGFRTHIPALVTGGRRTRSEGCYLVELEPDMHTVHGSERLLVPLEGPGAFPAGHGFFEASSIRKYDGRYVLVYSSEVNHELCYAVSDRPDGGFAYGGVLVSIGDVGLPGHRCEAHAANYLGNTHGGLLRLPAADAAGGGEFGLGGPGEGSNPFEPRAVGSAAAGSDGWVYYIFYHRQTNRSSYARQACAERLSGTPAEGFAQAEVTSCGLNGGPLAGCGRYPARIACNLWSADGAGRVDGGGARRRLAAHPYFTQEGRGSVARQYIANLRQGAVAGFKYFDLRSTSRLSVTVRGEGAGRLVVAADEGFHDRRAVVELVSNREWRRFEAAFAPGGAREALFFRFEGSRRIDFLEFELA